MLPKWIKVRSVEISGTTGDFPPWLQGCNQIWCIFPILCRSSASLDCPTVVRLHDLYPYEIPGNFGFPQVIFNRLVLRLCLRRVDAIACVSETTMLRLRHYASRSTWPKAVLIYNCVEPEPLCATLSPILDLWHEPFLLSIAQHRRNKNIGLLIRAFHRLLRTAEIDEA